MSSGRVQVTDIAVAHPGHCALCGSVGGDGRRFIDTGWAPEEYYGVVYYCTYCFAEIANQVGFVTTEQVLDTQRRLNETEEQLKKVNDECANLRSAVDALTASGYTLPDDGEDGVENSPEQPSGESGTPKSTDELGSGNVQSTPELDLSGLDIS